MTPPPHHDDSATGEEGESGPPDLGPELRELLGHGGDLEGRTARSLDRRLRSGSAAGLALELLGVGWSTAKEILSDRPIGADGEPGDDHG